LHKTLILKEASFYFNIPENHKMAMDFQKMVEFFFNTATSPYRFPFASTDDPEMLRLQKDGCL
jgi:hypothetical protein